METGIAIEKGTLVIINPMTSPRYGLVKAVSSTGPLTIETTGHLEIKVPVNSVIPLAQNCKSIPDGLGRNTLQMIKTLAVAIYRQQNQIEDSNKKIIKIQETLKKTNKRVSSSERKTNKTSE